MATKAQTMIEVLGRRKQIEDYLTNLKIERPADSTADPVIRDTATRRPITTVQPTKTDSTGVTTNKPADKPTTSDD